MTFHCPATGNWGPSPANTGLSLSVVQVDQYRAAARTVAEQPEKGKGLPDCQKDEEICVARFIDDLGLRAFRRPLGPPDRQDLLAVFRSGREGQTPTRGLSLVVEATLQAPAFLYVVERGQSEGNIRRLDSFELATRLSLLFWNGPPDSALLSAAAGVVLQSPDGIANWAAQLLADGRSASTIDTFVRGWLGLGGLATLTKDPERYPFFDESVRRALERETFSFADHVLRKSDARLSTLLSAPFNKCGTTTCASYLQEETSAGAHHCCTADRQCGSSSDFLFGRQCIPRGGPVGVANAACADEFPNFLDLYGCCRPDGQCGLTVDHVQNWDIGCIDRPQMARLLNAGSFSRDLLSLLFLLPVKPADFAVVRCTP